MMKALIMNSARYMTGAGANDTLWSNSQGMGEVSLNNYFDIFGPTSCATKSTCSRRRGNR